MNRTNTVKTVNMKHSILLKNTLHKQLFLSMEIHSLSRLLPSDLNKHFISGSKENCNFRCRCLSTIGFKINVYVFEFCFMRPLVQNEMLKNTN